MQKGQAHDSKPALILACSLLAHLLLLALPVADSDPPPRTGQRSISLVPPPAREVPDKPDLQAPPPAASEQATDEKQAVAVVEPLQVPHAPAPEPLEQPSTNVSDIRGQALEAARASITRDDHAGESSGMTFREIPRLPGTVGWMNAYVGTVTASSQYWHETDGSFQSRTVMADGQVICSSIRPPTVQEFFNPSMSAAVAMFRNCGRQRPGSPDAGDPWQRSPGAR